jgi:hypothetical protein
LICARFSLCFSSSAMPNDLIFCVLAVPESSSRLCRTHCGLDLHRRNGGVQVAHAHQVVGRAGEGKDPIHSAHATMAKLAHQGNRLQPAEALFDPFPASSGSSHSPHAAWCDYQSRCPPGRAWFCATCGVTRKLRHSFTKSRVSNPLSPPTVTGCAPGSFSSMTSAASRSAVPLA